MMAIPELRLHSSANDYEAYPDHEHQMYQYFWIAILIEYILCWPHNKNKLLVNDGITSIGASILMELTKLLCRGFELKAYVYIYSNFHVMELYWDSWWTLIIATLAVDFGFYWVHRFAHEISFIWAAHQVHHSSELYNLTTALRQSVFQSLLVWPVCLPLALFLPPIQFVILNQINYIYQCFLHTSVIDRLPACIERVFNTPNHHRVHHGSNKYCLDKNYGGILIIWDKMFGTFEEEKEEIVYGLTYYIDSFNPFWIQFVGLYNMWKKLKNIDGIKNKLLSIVCGPSWAPGEPRLGRVSDEFVRKEWRPLYNPRLPLWLSLYLMIHFSIVVRAFFYIYSLPNSFTIEALLLMVFIAVSLTSFGALLEKRYGSDILELTRCICASYFSSYLLPSVFFISAVIWGCVCYNSLKIDIYTLKRKLNLNMKEQ